MTAPLAATPEGIARAVDELRAGRPVAFPTETVYGLGADASDPAAVAAIYRLKGRPSRHPVIVHLASPELLPGWVAELPAAAEALIAAFWPGPLTLIVAAGPRAHAGVTGGQRTVGVRSPSHPVARALLERFGDGVAAPSANRFGRISPTRAEHVLADYRGVPDAPLVLDGGPSPVGLESTIVDLSGATPTLLRPGVVGASELAEVLGEAPGAAGASAPRTPGRLASHYAPATPTLLRRADQVGRELLDTPGGVGVLAFGREHPDAAICLDLGDDPVAAGRDLYAALRRLDGAGLRRIVIESPPAGPTWDAVRDRVTRAAAALPAVAGGRRRHEEEP